MTAGILATLPRAVLEALIEAAIAELDARDGDPDLEPEEDAEDFDADLHLGAAGLREPEILLPAPADLPPHDWDEKGIST